MSFTTEADRDARLRQWAAGIYPDEAAVEPGHVIARSCAIGEAYIRAGLREGQAAMFYGCSQQNATVAGP